jgi:hypothetical protein
VSENAQEHRITSVTDFLKLDKSQFERMLPDFILWFNLCKKLDPQLVKVEAFIWRDDAAPGQLHSVEVTDGKTSTQIKGPAYGH